MSQATDTAAFRLQAVSISGPDAIEFVQSQLTLDLESTDATAARPAAWCKPDGRVAISMLALCREGVATLIVPENLCDELLRLAGLYRIGRRLDIDAPVPAAGLEADASPVPGEADESGRAPLAYDRDRLLQFGSGVEPQALSAAWLARDIESGMPWLVPETSGRFLPQMIGLDELGGLSYTKGCYPGQEVIARVHYRGRATRRPTRFHFAAGAVIPSPGTEFAVGPAHDPADGGRNGIVLYATAREDGSITGLAVVAAECPHGASIMLEGTAGRLD